MKTIGIILARGGSKRIPKKNLMPLNGIALIDYTINAAISSNCFDEIIVSTDCPEIKNHCKDKAIRYIDRPKELVDDNASSADGVIHVLENIDQSYEVGFLLQPTSPLRTASHVKEAIELYIKKNTKTLVSVTAHSSPSPFKSFYFKKDKLIPFRDFKDLSTPAQNLPSCYFLNGAIYIFSISSFLKTPEFINKNTSIYIMDKVSGIDIDTMEDWQKAEEYIKKNSLFANTI